MDRTRADNVGVGTGSVRGYALGFGLSLVLTIIAFALVRARTISPSAASGGIVVAAVIQILAHLRYFLHLDTSSAARWNLLALCFTLLIMVLFVGGTLWIMYNLNYRMM